MREQAAILWEHMRREWALTRRFLPNTIAGVMTVYVFIVALYLAGRAMTPGGAVDVHSFSGTVVGMMVWSYSSVPIWSMGWMMSQEASTGTLEQLWVNPTGPVSVLVHRAIVNNIKQTADTAAVLALVALTLPVRLELPLVPLLVIIPLTVVGMTGFGFALAGVTLLWKRTNQILNLLHFFLLLFTGAMVPLDQLHPALLAFGRTLPLTHGVEAIRAVTVYGKTLGDLTPVLAGLTLNSAVYLAAGIIIFLACDRRARQLGAVGGY